MIELTSAQAKALADSNWWDDLSPSDIALFQLHTDLLCLPFSVFHVAVERALGRGVWTHEFGTEGSKLLLGELLGGSAPMSDDEVLALLPERIRKVVAPNYGRVAFGDMIYVVIADNSAIAAYPTKEAAFAAETRGYYEWHHVGSCEWEAGEVKISGCVLRRGMGKKEIL